MMKYLRKSMFSRSVRPVSVLLAVWLILSAFSACSGVSSGSSSAPNSTTPSAKTASDPADNTVTEPYQPDPAHGSAVTMEGKTLLLSIFTSDKDTSWDYDSETDRKLMDDTLSKLRIATGYLTEQAARFDKDLSFVYDWSQSDDLLYQADFDETLVRYDSGGNVLQRQWLREHIDLSALMQKYGADDVIFLFYFNTDADNPINSWELSYIDGVQIDLEFCNFYLKFDGGDMPTASFAHELMHPYGAKDLYYQGDDIPEEFVTHLEETGSQDIMFTVFGEPDMIINDFTDLDAYYVGIAPRPAIADEWNLGPSEHDAS